jgi:hypothetical protein
MRELWVAFAAPVSSRSPSSARQDRWSTRWLQAASVWWLIAPNQLKNLRSRYGSAGNKDDGFDAYVLAEVVRHRPRRLRPLASRQPAPP